MISSNRIVLILLGLALVSAFIFMMIWREPVTEPSGERSAASDLGIMEEMNLTLPADEIDPLRQRALRGDNRAAKALANHYRTTGRPDEERRWAMAAADRGDCGAMSLLRENAERAGDSRGAARWNEALRRNACTWGKAYPDVSNPQLESLPLWNEQ